ncbi:translation elongation factor Ts [Filifactor villosus]|uniref:Elongation factor Ts n=1 Tax=Filifactor villosus TaxID=29374 RepID=A0ABV9QL68_9FIRM
MEITASMVKELREQTQAGMMDCKKALVEAEGDMAKAVDILREKGLSKAAKKAGRIAAEGLVALVVSDDHKVGAIVEVNSETDFVAKNEEFKTFVSEVANFTLKTKPADMDALKAAAFEEDKSLETVLNEKISKIGENMSIRRFAVEEQEKGAVVGYVHGAGKIAVLVNLASEASADQLQELGKDIAMQVASMNPKYISSDDVDADYIAHEKEILMAQAINENEEEAAKGKKKKPVEIIEKMVVGRLQKELKEVCLLEQVFVKNSDFTVGQVVKNVAKEVGNDISVVSIVRFEVGEGLEKKEENFAEEVAKQMGN